MNENNTYEVEIRGIGEHWREVGWLTFRSWPFRRRVNGQEFHGRVFYYMSPKVIYTNYYISPKKVSHGEINY